MNSDPRESASWRAFGMLDTDETAGFDEALRRDPDLQGASQEIDRLSAAIAAATVTPVKPHPGQLERLHARLGINAPKRRNWTAITGWSAAAAITLLAILDHGTRSTGQPPVAGTPPEDTPAIARITPPGEETAPLADEEMPPELVVGDTGPEATLIPDAGVAPLAGDLMASARVETRRLIQEIGVLRQALMDLEQRESERFDVVPGMSQFVMIEMRPPGFKDVDEASIGDPPLASYVGDAIAAAGRNDTSKSGAFGTTGATGPAGTTGATGPTGTDTATGLSGGTTALTPPPASNTTTLPASGYPIYDPARDTGTLVVNNLPPKTADETYNLWVQTKRGKEPVYVGELPETTIGGENQFDFSLGEPGIVPSRFFMTKDPRGKSRPPTNGNTILQGPN